VAGCQEVIDDKISYVTAQPLTARKVKEEMHSGKDAAQRCFLRLGGFPDDLKPPIVTGLIA
jgi:hypothetical protein